MEAEDPKQSSTSLRHSPQKATEKSQRAALGTKHPQQIPGVRLPNCQHPTWRFQERGSFESSGYGAGHCEHLLALKMLSYHITPLPTLGLEDLGSRLLSSEAE